MAEMFSDKADLSGIPEIPSQELYVSYVGHKAIVEVNENGTIAAGAAIGKYSNKLNNFICICLCISQYFLYISS